MAESYLVSLHMFISARKKRFSWLGVVARCQIALHVVRLPLSKFMLEHVGHRDVTHIGNYITIIATLYFNMNIFSISE